MTYKRHLNITIRPDNFEENVKVFLKEIRPAWDINNLNIKKFPNGISNIMYGVYVDQEFTTKTDMILIRIDGESLFDRDVEMGNMQALSRFDLAAEVFDGFRNGCSYRYIHGTMLTLADMSDPRFIPLIVREFAKLHLVDLKISRPKQPFLFPKMRELISRLPDHLPNPDKNDMFLLHFPNQSDLLKEVECLENNLVKSTYPIAFCHNDVLVNNLILNPDQTRVHFIDFEYAQYNYCGFDIGNHFNEFAGLDNVDYNLYPTEEFQKMWIRKYLESRQSISNPDLICDVDENEVIHWYKMVNKFSLASHLIWCIWSIIQDQNVDIEFDYISYAILRWNQYKSNRDKFLAL